MIKIPITVFNIRLNFPYFSLADTFCTNPTEVPATITSVLCPIEYIRSSNAPQSKLPSFATVASSTTSTGVAQGDEKKPPRIPASSAPIYPLLVFFEIANEEGIKLYISQICSAIKTINIPRIRYHQVPVPIINLPSIDAATPRTVNVTADPAAKVSDSRKALLVPLFPTPPTKPITNGTLDKAQGVKDVKTPAIRANNGVSHIFAAIEKDKFSSHLLMISFIRKPHFLENRDKPDFIHVPFMCCKYMLVSSSILI